MTVPLVTKLAVALIGLCLIAAVFSGFGYRLQWWSYGAGFKILAAAVVGAGIGVLLALVGAYLSWRGAVPAGVAWSLAAVVVGAIVVGPPLLQLRAVRQLPYIHDITTDTVNPPAFVAILSERANAPNTAEYGGAEIAEQQRKAYPDIRPLRLQTPVADVFVAALETAGGLGWRIVESDPAAGRIEASDQTFWYGFVDDVVIRITAEGSTATRVDVRSVSRVGKSDIGANAARIRKFLDRLAARLDAARGE